MADQVEVIIERLVLEMKQMVDAGLFSEVEARKIMKKRRDHQYLAHRPVASISDFLRAFIFEAKLEKIRAKRNLELREGKERKFDFFILQRIMHICDRLLRKNKGNLEIWKLYIDYLAKKNCHKKLQLVLSKAIRIHPQVPDFWIVGAYAMMENENDSQGGRALLQQGLIRNNRNIDYWGEYLRYEIQAAALIQEREKILFAKRKNEDKDLQIIEEVEIIKENNKEETEEVKLNYEVLRAVVEAGVEQSSKQHLIALPSHFFQVLCSPDFSHLNLKPITKQLISLVKQAPELQSHYLLLLVRSPLYYKEKPKQFQSEILRLLNSKTNLDKSVMIELLRRLLSLGNFPRIWTALFSSHFLPTLLKICQNQMSILHDCIQKQRILSRTEIYKQIFKLIPDNEDIAIHISERTAKVLSPQDRIKALQDFLLKNKLMSSSSESSLKIRIQLLKIAAHDFSTDIMIKSFVTVAELFLGSEFKFRKLEEAAQKLLKEDVTEATIQSLLQFYVHHRLKPSYGMINVAGLYAQSQATRSVLEKLQS